MNDAGDAKEADETTVLYAQASEQAQIIQAGRDQHIYYGDGTRRVRRTETGDAWAECPYPGLAAFSPEQYRWFFGREQVVADLIERLHVRLTRAGSRGIQVVMAPSGAGKSSLLRAGLIPELAKSRLPSSGTWPVRIFTPTTEPLRALRDNITALLGPDADTADGRSAAMQSVPHSVLVVDQFEELFTLCGNEKEQRDFITLLNDIATTGGEQSAVLVVVGIRADFCPACANHEVLRAALGDQPLIVGPMEEPELRAAILLPAQDVRLDVEDGLVELLLSDLGGASANYAAERLPLLAHSLQASWRQRSGSTLTVEGYRATGGLKTAVAQSADRTFAELRRKGSSAGGPDPAGMEDLIRQFFLQLVRIGKGTDDVRRRVRRDTLLENLPPVAGEILEQFTAARLVTQVRRSAANDIDVQITHEILLRAWPRLRSWLDNDRMNTVALQDLEEHAEAWDGNDSSALLRGSRLDRAAVLSRNVRVSSQAAAFLAASQKRQRLARIARQATAGVVALLLIAVGIVYDRQQREKTRTEQQAKLAQAAAANQAATRAESIRQRDPALATLLSQAAYRIDPSVPAARNSLLSSSGGLRERRILEAATGQPGGLAFDVQGRLVTVRPDSAVRRWNTGRAEDESLLTPAATPPPEAGSKVHFAMSGDSKLIAVVVGAHRLQLWDTTDLTRPATALTVADRVITEVALDRNGSRLAVGTDQNGTRLYEISSGRDLTETERWVNSQRLSLPTGFVGLGQDLTDVKALEFSPDGRWLAIGSVDTSINIRSVSRPADAPVRLKERTSGRIYDLEFIRKGRSLVALRDEVVERWDGVDKPRSAQAGKLSPAINSPADLAISPDGAAIAVAQREGEVTIFKTDGMTEEETLPHTETVNALAYDPRGNVLAAGSADGTVHLWSRSPTDGVIDGVAAGGTGNLLAQRRRDGRIQLLRVADGGAWEPPKLLSTITGYNSGDAQDLQISQGDKYLSVQTSRSGTVDVWKITDPTKPEHRGKITAVTGVSSQFIDDRTLATLDTSDDFMHPRLNVWDLEEDHDGQPVGTWTAGARQEQLLFPRLSVSPDGRTAAVYSVLAGEEAALVDVSDHSKPTQVGTIPATAEGVITEVVFDGRGTAAVDSATGVALWNVSEPRTPAKIADFGGYPIASSLVFSPGGTTVALAADDNTVVLWNRASSTWTSADLTGPAAVLTGHSGQVDQIGFSSDGKTLISQGAGELHLWSLDPETSQGLACRAAGTALTETEWTRAVPGVEFNDHCLP